MEILIKLLTVLALGTVSPWAAIPTGFVLKLDPLVTGITASIGAILGVVVVLALGERIRSWASKHYSREGWLRGRIYRIRACCGVAGFGLLSPLFVGAPLGTIIGVALGLPAGRLLLWMSLGIILLSAGTTFAIALGFVDIEAMWH